MNLHIVRDEARQAIAVANLPLGPWAGATVTTYATATGTRWHADIACPSLRSRARTDSFQQPGNGTLGDRTLPPGLHCSPTGVLGDYIEIASRLVRYSHATDAAELALAKEDLPLSVLPTADYWTDDAFGRSPTTDPLAEIIKTEHVRRDSVVEQLRHQLQHTDLPMARLAIASWLRAGRTPRQHQDQYVHLLEVGIETLDAGGLVPASGPRDYLNDLLPGWLDDVLSGSSIANASASLIAYEVERHSRLAAIRPGREAVADHVATALTEVCSRWGDVVEAMAAAHPGTVLALLHRYGGNIDRTLVDTCIDVGPSALLEVGDTSWVAAVVPAAMRLQLNERRHGLAGLVIAEPAPWDISSAKCVDFLRHLVKAVADARLADHVTSGRGTDISGGAVRRTVPQHRTLPGFARGTSDWGITTAECVPHLRKALT